MSLARDRLFDLYEGELSYIREMGKEFADDFGKVARRLDLRKFDCEDPYVERLLEGFAFLAARVRLKIDDEFSTFTQSLLQVVFPHLLPPTPSMAIVRFEPKLEESGLEQGYLVKRGTPIYGVMRAGDATSCQFTTASDVQLWPIVLSEAAYLPTPSAIASAGALPGGAKAAIRLRLETRVGFTFAQLPIDRLRLFLSGGGALPGRIYERLIAHARQMVVSDPDHREDATVLGPEALKQAGFADDEAMLPYDHRSFQGYRLLHEYFSLPERFSFVELTGLSAAIGRCQGQSLDILILLDEGDEALEDYVDKDSFALFACPAINLFEMELDHLLLNSRDAEFHVVPNRSRPIDFEIHDLLKVQGVGDQTAPATTFDPFYKVDHGSDAARDRAFYAVRREPKLVRTAKDPADRLGAYRGSELYISLVDAKEAPYSPNLRQLAIRARCTNRDLPVRIMKGGGATDFSIRTGAPVASIRALVGPTPPRESIATGNTAWRIISHLSLNHLSIGGYGHEGDEDAQKNAAALSELLSIYSRAGGAKGSGADLGVAQVRTEPVTARLPIKGPMVFGRGMAVDVAFHEMAVDDGSAFLLGAVLERFLARYASINTFTKTTIRSAERGIIMQWPARIGARLTL